MAKPVSLILGIGLVLVGIAGYFAPALLGMHLSTAHSAVHLGTGVISILFSFASPGAARIFCIVFGLVYGLFLGVGGFGIGEPGSTSVHVPGPPDQFLWQVIPGVLELGTMDHIVHVALGVIYLAGGIFTRKRRGYREYKTR